MRHSNTDTGLELDNLARLLQMAVDYAKEIGFTGQFLIEPKPKSLQSISMILIQLQCLLS